MAVEIDFSKFDASIDKLVRSIDMLDDRLSSLDTRLSLIKRAFGTNKEMKDFVENLNTMAKGAGKNFKEISLGVKYLSTSLQTLEGLSDKPTSSINNISEILKNITKAAENAKKLKPSMISDIISYVKIAFEEMRELEPAVPDVVIRSVRSINNLVKTLSEIDPDMVDLNASQLPALIIQIGDLLGIILKSKAFGLGNEIAEALGHASKAINSITRIIRAYTQLQQLTPSALPVTSAESPVNRFFLDFGSLIGVIKVDQIKRLDKNVIDALGVISRIVRTIVNFQTVKIEKDALSANVEAVKAFFVSSGQDLTDMFNSINALPDIRKNMESLSSLVNALRTIQRVASSALIPEGKLDEKAVDQVAKIMTRLLGRVGGALMKVPNLGNIAAIADVVKAIGSIMRVYTKMQQLAPSTNEGKDPIKEFITNFEEIIKVVKNQKLEEVESASKVIRAISSIISAYISMEKDMPTGLSTSDDAITATILPGGKMYDFLVNFRSLSGILKLPQLQKVDKGVTESISLLVRIIKAIQNLQNLELDSTKIAANIIMNQQMSLRIFCQY